MRRDKRYEALVLKVRPSGESNREAFFLTAEEGILRATLYGGPKSRLRSHVASYARGTLWLYGDPAKGSRKITDFDVTAWRPGIRELYERVTAAAVLAETALAGHGGGGGDSGGFGEALGLLDESLDALDGADGRASVVITLQFLWRWLGLLGIRPDLDFCASCGKSLGHEGDGGRGGACPPAGDSILWYAKDEGGVLCPSCGDNSGKAASMELSQGLRRWFTAASNAAFRDVPRYTLGDASRRQAKALLGVMLNDSSAAPSAAYGEWAAD